MTLYAGETTRIQTTGTDLDGTALTQADVVNAYVTIYRSSDKVEILAQSPMVYDSTAGGWTYDWDTSAVTFGTYLAKVRFVGSDYDTWEFVRIRLNKNPV